MASEPIQTDLFEFQMHISNLLVDPTSMPKVPIFIQVSPNTFSQKRSVFHSSLPFIPHAVSHQVLFHNIIVPFIPLIPIRNYNTNHQIRRLNPVIRSSLHPVE